MKDLKIIIGGIFYWLNKILPWVFLICTFLLLYGSLHTGKGYKDVALYALVTLLYFSVNRRGK